MVVYNRKGKTVYVYDVQIKLEWEGELLEKQDDKVVCGKGTIYIEDLSNDEDKWKWTIKMENESAENRLIKEELKNNELPQQRNKRACRGPFPDPDKQACRGPFQDQNLVQEQILYKK